MTEMWPPIEPLMDNQLPGYFLVVLLVIMLGLAWVFRK